MSKYEDACQQVKQLLQRCDRQEVEQFLLLNSNLPGPRGNLELALAFASAYATNQASDEQLSLVWAWAAEGMTLHFQPSEREYLPVCALQALGAHYAYSNLDRQSRIMNIMRQSANATAWRVRESVAIGMQLMAEWDFAATSILLQRWLDDNPTLLEARAVAATLAHPPVLGEQRQAAIALQMMQQIVAVLRASEQRKSDQYRVLRQALEYALSVVIAADLAPGFAVLAAMAVDDDRDVLRVVAKNLERNRLKRHVEEVAAIKALLERA